MIGEPAFLAGCSTMGRVFFLFIAVSGDAHSSPSLLSMCLCLQASQGSRQEGEEQQEVSFTVKG